MFKILNIALCLCAFIAGCKSTKEIDRAKESGLLLVGIGPDPDSMDPHIGEGVTEQNVLRALFEGLVRPDPKTLDPLPGVAQSWSVSDDGCVYTFQLRKNACWSNGEPLTAEDFVFSFQRLLTPAVASAGAASFASIQNAKAFFHNEVTFDKVGVKALDRLTLQFKLEQPTPYFLSLLMQTCAYPVHRKTLATYGGLFSRNPMWTRENCMVSNGPFCLKHRKIGECIEVAKNKYYWNACQVRLNGIKFKPISDLATEERAFRSHQLHITENVPYARLRPYFEQKDSQLKIHPYLGTFYYIFNTHVKPLDDVRVRQALNLAVHREQLKGNDLFRIKQKSTLQFVPEGCQGFHSQVPLQEDAQRARQLLAEAGYPNGKNFPSLTLMFNTTEGQTYLASAIQEMWKKELNIDVKLINYEWKVYLKRRREKSFDIARGGWIGDYNDPTTFLNLWLEDNANNYTYWSHPIYTDLLQKATKESDPNKRMELLENAEAIVLKEAPLLPLHENATSHLVHISVKNWFPNLLDWHPYDCIYLE